MVGQCYEHRCTDSGDVYVRLPQSSQWILCPAGETVSVTVTCVLLRH